MKKLTFTFALSVILFAVAGVSWSVGQAMAQSGANRADAPLSNGFTYQGFLNKNGTAITANCDFQFTLWDQALGGSQVGALQQIDDVSVLGGRFTTVLNSTGQMIAKPFTGKARYLKVAVRCPGDPNFTELFPRQNLTAAPYAHSLRPGAIISGTTNINEGALNIRGNYDGLRVSGADNGIHITSSGGHALNIGSPEDDGVFIRTAVNGIEMDQISSNGVYLNGVQENGLHVISAGSNGVQVDSYGNIGIQVKGGITETAIFAASFLGDVDIQGNLSCSGSGCGTRSIAINGGDAALTLGDVVAIAGIMPAENGTMLIQVRKATAGDAIYGVVAGSAEFQQDTFVKTDAPAPAGAPLFVVTEGMAQVDAGQLGSAEIGHKIGMAGSRSSSTLGLALEVDATRDGLIWVLVDPQ